MYFFFYESWRWYSLSYEVDVLFHTFSFILSQSAIKEPFVFILTLSLHAYIFRILWSVYSDLYSIFHIFNFLLSFWRL